MDTLFEKIARGEIPSFKVWEDEKFYAFLDIHPLTKGHTLVIPRQNVGDYLFDMESGMYTELMLAAKKVAHLLKQKIDCERVIMMVEGFDVPHVHIKLVPVPLGFNIATAVPQETNMEALAEVGKVFA